MTILETRGLKKIYGLGETAVKALDGIDLKVERGEFLAIVGTSGSGKSTFLNLVGGLDVPTQGEIILDGSRLSQLSDDELTIFRRRKIGFIFQQYNLIPMLSVWENIVLPLKMDGKRVDEDYIMEIIGFLGLHEKLKNAPGRLSGGQQQRVAIGRALVMRPMLVLADEPTGNLDSRSSRDVMDLLCKASRHYQQTVLMITHNMNLTASVDRVMKVSDGVLTEMGGVRR